MTRLLLKLFSWRHARLAPRTTLLLVLILAVGVASYFSVRLANRAAQTGFNQFSNLLTVQSDWIITPPAGRLPDSVVPEIRAALGSVPAVIIPALETTGTEPRPPGSEADLGQHRPTFTITGLDLASLWQSSAAAGLSGKIDWSLTAALHPRAVFIPAAHAQGASLKPGSVFPLVVDDAVVEFQIAGVLPQTADGIEIPPNMMFMELAKLQTLTDRARMLDRVEFVIPSGPRQEEYRAEVRRVLDRIAAGRWVTASPNERRDSVQTMTRAFSLNLTILSLLAMLVGLYLIFQALDGAVVRRREEIAILRSLGVTASAIRRAWLAEAALLGLAGGVLGGLMGWGAAQWTIVAVGRTVNTLYHSVSAQSASLHAGEFAAAIALGCCAGILAGWYPARNAALTPPAQILRRHSIAGTTGGKRSALFALILLLLAAGAALLPPLRFADGGRIAAGGYLSALLAILGGGLLCGPALRATARLLSPLAERSAILRIALSQLRSATSRHRTAAAGLLCATAMTAGMAVMISSFDHTMRSWIERSFLADLYISSDGAQSASSQNRIAPATTKSLLAMPGAGDANVIHAMPVEIGEKSTILAAGSTSFIRDHETLQWLLEPDSDAIFDPTKSSKLCLVSEAFTERFGLTRGDTLELPTPAGPQHLRITGVFSDYGNERGTLVIDRDHFIRWYTDEMAASIILYCQPGHDPAAMRAEILRRYPGLTVFTNATLRAQILKIFQQSFRITWAMEIIGLLVAVAGVALSMASMLIERRSELTTLRSMGMTHREIARASAAEGTGIAISGLLPGTLLCLALGWLLIRVINKQTFGWTLIFTIPWWQLAAFAALIIASAAAAGWWAGRRAAKLPADREE